MKSRIVYLLFFFPLLFLFSSIVCAESVVQGETKDVMVDETFSINISCVPSEPIKGWEFKISFDPSIIQVETIYEGAFFNGYPSFFVSGIIDNTNGTISEIYDLIVGQGNVSSQGVLLKVFFRAVAEGETIISFSNVGLVNETQYLVNIVNDGFVVVHSEEAPEPDAPDEPAPDAPDEGLDYTDPPSDINPIVEWILSMKEIIVTCTIFICLFLHIWSKLL